MFAPSVPRTETFPRASFCVALTPTAGEVPSEAQCSSFLAPVHSAHKVGRRTVSSWPSDPKFCAVAVLQTLTLCVSWPGFLARKA